MNRLLDIGLKAVPFVLIIAATAVASLWNFDKVRLWVVAELSKRDLQRVEGALEDPSDEVAARACLHVMERGEGAPPPYLMEVLGERPDVAFMCLREAAEAEAGAPPRAALAADGEAPDGAGSAADEGSADVAHRAEDAPDEDEGGFNPFATREADLVPRHELVASGLGNRWMSGLFEGKANSCQTAQNARRAMEHAHLDATYRLTACAVAADSADVRQCCVEELGGPEAFAELMDRPDIVPLRQANADYAALVGASFPSVPIASAVAEAQQNSAAREVEEDEEETGEVQKSDGERFGQTQAAVQDWVVEVGCRLHFTDPSSRRVVEAFVPLVESNGCAPTDPPWQGYYSEQSWTEMCIGMYEYRRDGLDMSPREAMCSSLERASISQAATATQLTVAAALGVAGQLEGIDSEEWSIAEADRGRRGSRNTARSRRSSTSMKSGRILNSFFQSIVGP